MEDSKINLIDELKYSSYDIFIGREHCDGNKTYDPRVTLNLHSLGSCSYISFGMALDELCSVVKHGKRVLLTQSPGRKEPEIINTTNTLETLGSILENILTEDESAIMLISGQKNETITISGRTYYPYTAEELKRLQTAYEKKEEMKQFPNPFDYQPPKL